MYVPGSDGELRARRDVNWDGVHVDRQQNSLRDQSSPASTPTARSNRPPQGLLGVAAPSFLPFSSWRSCFQRARERCGAGKEAARLSGVDLLNSLRSAGESGSTTSAADIFATLRCATEGVSTTGGRTSVTEMSSGRNCRRNDLPRL